MLKKLLCTLIIALSCLLKIEAQAIIVQPSDSVTVDTTLYTGLATTSRTITIQNSSTTDSLMMKWKPLTNTMPHSWGVSFCDPKNCLAYILPNGEPYTLAPGQGGIWKLDMTPNCLADTGLLRILTWAPADSANTATVLVWKNMIATQGCYAAGITTIDQSQISLYPNPARNEVRINLPSNVENGQIEVFNLLGSKVLNQSVSKGKDLDISALESGLYVVRISENGKVIATKKLTKAAN